MPLSVTELAADLDHVIADLPATVFFSGVTGSGAITPIDRAQTLDMNGMMANVDFTAVLPVGTFSTMPVRNDAMRVTRTGGSAENVRVVSCQVSPDGVAWEVALTKDTRA